MKHQTSYFYSTTVYSKEIYSKISFVTKIRTIITEKVEQALFDFFSVKSYKGFYPHCLGCQITYCCGNVPLEAKPHLRLELSHFWTEVVAEDHRQSVEHPPALASTAVTDR